DSFKEHYHRVHLPRRLALQRYARQQSLRNAAKGNVKAEEVPYKYNRWWVNEEHEFVHQYAFVEDPEVTKAKRETLPPVTRENIWKEPQQTFFLPFAPYVRVVDYPKDPDAKFLKPVNIPRWKDYMQRTKPVIPRTWY
nr:Chain Bc, mL95 [Trypanosoma brucei]